MKAAPALAECVSWSPYGHHGDGNRGRLQSLAGAYQKRCPASFLMAQMRQKPTFTIGREADVPGDQPKGPLPTRSRHSAGSAPTQRHTEVLGNSLRVSATPPRSRVATRGPLRSAVPIIERDCRGPISHRGTVHFDLHHHQSAFLQRYDQSSQLEGLSSNNRALYDKERIACCVQPSECRWRHSLSHWPHGREHVLWASLHRRKRRYRGNRCNHRVSPIPEQSPRACRESWNLGLVRCRVVGRNPDKFVRIPWERIIGGSRYQSG